MPVVSTGQVTIIDYNDAISLTGYISTNQPLVQVYNPDNGSYSPNYTASPFMVLTPSLFIMGSSGDIITSNQIKSIKWFDSAAPTTEILNGGSYTLGTFTSGQNRPLTIKGNILSGATNAKTFIVEIIYTDATTGLDLTYKNSVTISRITNGSGIVNAIITATNGNVFKTGISGNLTAKAELWRGSTVDTTSVTYQWFKQDSAVSTDQGGGIGWRKLDSANTGGGTTGWTAQDLVVPPAAVTSLAVFKCLIKDTDATSPSYNQTFMATQAFVDQTDAIQLQVVSSGGDVFKNGNGSSTLTAKLYQANGEIDTGGTTYTYKWYKYDQNGTLVANWGGTGINFKTGKTLNVGGADVDVKATFVCEVE